MKSAIDGQGKLTEELSAAIDNAATLAEVEDLYRPYKQKRRTRATIAREKGLEPLAAAAVGAGAGLPGAGGRRRRLSSTRKRAWRLWRTPCRAPTTSLPSCISDDAAIRKTLRGLLMRQGHAAQPGRQGGGQRLPAVLRLRPARLPKLAGHQILAVNRGEKEGFLSVTVLLDRDAALRHGAAGGGEARLARPSAFVKSAACEDAYDRLIYPSLEREARATLTDTAGEGAIGQFALNLKPLLMQPPVKGHVTMGLDPGYAHGCKVAVIDGTGKVLDTTVVYPTYGERQKKEAIARLHRLVRQLRRGAHRHRQRHRQPGDGADGGGADPHGLAGGVSYMIVNEAGASVYSASKLAAEEFPEYDVNLRSAVSIARRLQDPLAELVKIDPKAIGVGQYQHDMPQKRLDETLAGVVEDCVNAVGVDVNTASASLLSRVSGLNATTAKNIVKYREENGTFTARKQLLKVPKLGPKAFEQCAGFLRVPESKSVLDNTGVHPESYAAAEQLLGLCGYTLADVKDGETAACCPRR